LLLRNLFSCPGPTRLTGYATILFVLGGLANQNFAPHLCYSSYTITYALASHHLIDGWDRDVIAEDHHMFCKCFFASIWEQLEAQHILESKEAGNSGASTSGVKPMMQLTPVFLPATSYLVQSDGWLSSIMARFTQARRHAQGLAELSYVLLQHFHLLRTERTSRLALFTHTRIAGIAGKMSAVHIIAPFHCLAVILATSLLVEQTFRWILSLGISGVLQTLTERGLEGWLAMKSLDGVKWALCAVFGALPPMGIMLTGLSYVVVKDLLEGKLTKDASILKKIGATEPAVPDIQGSAIGPNGLGFWRCTSLLAMMIYDHVTGGVVTMVLYGLIPAAFASWSLLFQNGLNFAYVVGAKPKDKNE